MKDNFSTFSGTADAVVVFVVAVVVDVLVVVVDAQNECHEET